jgi:predicted RNase H-related nuclease YkuK (DUF458 family)
MAWTKLDGTPLDGNIKGILENAIIKEKALGYRLKVCVGTDSQVYKKIIEFATVVVIYREGKGGFMFVNHFKEKRKLGIKERMIYEVSKSIEVAYDICNILDTHKVELEVHADINTDPQFKSNPALSEAMGYIKGMGFIFKAKPFAFASTSCANKVV